MALSARLLQRGSSAWRSSCANLVERAGKLRAQQAVVALDPPGAADHHMIGASNALHRHDFARECPESALHAVADNCSADLLGDRETNAHLRLRILAVADQQDEAGRGGALAGVRGKEV